MQCLQILNDLHSARISSEDNEHLQEGSQPAREDILTDFMFKHDYTETFCVNVKFVVLNGYQRSQSITKGQPNSSDS